MQNGTGREVRDVGVLDAEHKSSRKQQRLAAMLNVMQAYNSRLQYNLYTFLLVADSHVPYGHATVLVALDALDGFRHDKETTSYPGDPASDALWPNLKLAQVYALGPALPFRGQLRTLSPR